MNISFLSRTSTPSWPSTAGFLTASLLSLGGCAGSAIVAEPGPEQQPTDVDAFVPQQVSEAMGGASSCATEYEAGAAAHDRWVLATNDFGNLEDTTWSGDILFIGQSGGGRQVKLNLGQLGGSLEAGEQQSLTPDAPYPPLADMFTGSGPIDGVTYPLRGATVTGNELVLIIHPASFLEEWCTLQTPHFDEVNDCSYMTFPNVGLTRTTPPDGGPPQCTLTPDPNFVRDCRWFDQGRYCSCTPGQCFAEVDFPDVQAHETAEDYSGDYLVMRLTHDAEANTLTGNALIADEEYHVDLALE